MLEGLKLEDFVVLCKECKGSGDPKDPTVPGSFQELGEGASRSGIQLCRCTTEGKKTPGVKELTEAGRTLAGFLRWLERNPAARQDRKPFG